MSVYGTPKFEWKWEHDALIRQQPSNIWVQRLIESEEEWKGQPVPSISQIKSRRITLRNLDRVNQFRERNGEPILERPHIAPSFDETQAHLLGTLPDAMLGDKLGVPAQTVRFARLERRIPSYKDTRHSAYDPEMEEDMLKTVREIRDVIIQVKDEMLAVDFLEFAQRILHKIDPVWISQCLDRLEREQNVGTTEV